jgi:chromosome segregation ATPase
MTDREFSRRNVSNPNPTLASLRQELVERLIQVERDVAMHNRYIPDVQRQIQAALTSIADSNSKMVVHFEDNKHQHRRIDEQDAHVENIRLEIVRLERAIVELKVQGTVLIDFTRGIKKIGWFLVTSLLAMLVWATQQFVIPHG